MIIDCPICKAENPFRVIKCQQCGYSFEEDKARELTEYENQTRLTPERSAAWIMYAYALMRYNRKAEALRALDEALPKLDATDSTLSEYTEAARLYALADKPDYAQRLLADGLLYNMDHFRQELDAEEVSHAASVLLAIADDVFRRKIQSGKGPKNVISSGIANEVGLGTYELAERLASPPNQRLYPSSQVMVDKSSGAVAKQQTNKNLMKVGIGVVVLLLLFACVLSQCAAM